MASRDHSNSGSRVESAPSVVGSSSPRLTPSLQDLAWLFLSLSGSHAQWDAVMGSAFSAAAVSGAGVLPGPAVLRVHLRVFLLWVWVLPLVLPWSSWVARVSRLSEISCCPAKIPSCLMYARRSQRKRLPAYVMLTFPRLLVSSLLLCLTLPRPRYVRLRTTLLSSGPCIHQRFLGSLWRGRSRLGPRPLPLLIVAATHPLCLSRRSRRRQPPPLPLPSRVGRGGNAKVRHPFRWPPAAPSTLVATKGVRGRSPLDGVPPPLRVGGCLSVHWRHWQAIGAEPWVLSVLRDRYRIPFKDSPPPPPPPLARTSISFPTYSIGQNLLGHWLCARRSRRCCPRTPWKSSSVWISASTVVFSCWKR